MGSSHHPVPCSLAAEYVCQELYTLPRHVEERASAQRPMGGRGVRGRPEQIHGHVRQLDNSVGWREKQYKLQMYKNLMSMQIPGTHWHSSQLIHQWSSWAWQSSRVSQRAFSSQSSEKLFSLRSYKPTHNGRSVCAGQHNKGRMACCFLIKNVKGLGFKCCSLFALVFFFTQLLCCRLTPTVAVGQY